MKNLLTSYARLTTLRWQSWYAIPLRLIVGYGFMEHGYAKLVHGPDSFTAILHALGMPAPALLAWATILVELLGGFAVLVGAFIPIASIPMVITLLVAIFTVHVPNGFSSIKLLSVDAAGAHFGQPGYETDLLYMAGIFAIVLGGSGRLALDRLLLRRFGVTEHSALGFRNVRQDRPTGVQPAGSEKQA
ncbi:MAG TPA: DoxX family protein [Isosphaeraceae bacterium]|nr:DoxX family protein [Isosphaeraceae bacterium]